VEPPAPATTPDVTPDASAPVPDAAPGPVEVSIVTPAYAAEDTLEAALAAILAQDTERSLEVIVVDDGSPDGTLAVAERIAAAEPRVRAVATENGGEASALNVGFREARGDFVAIVEADVEPEPRWLETCLAALADDAEVYAAGGYLETPPDDPWIARLAGYEIEAKFRTKPREAKHLTSANVVYRRAAWDLAGPFDERLVNASLDSVFNGKLVQAGKRLVYVPEARVRHHYKTTFPAYLRRQYAYARYRVHNEILELYPADRFLAVHVALAALGAGLTAAAPLGLLLPAGPARWAGLAAGPGLLVLAGLLQLPRALGYALGRRDPAALLYPPVVLVRNVVGALGYAVGVLMKAAGRV